MQNAPREHSAILSTFIKLPFVFKTFVLSIFEWPLKTGFTVFLQTVHKGRWKNHIVAIKMMKERTMSEDAFLEEAKTMT